MAEQLDLITPWINPGERITVQLDDQGDINTVVAGCTEQLVDLELETPVPHMRQKLSFPLSAVQGSEDPNTNIACPGKDIEPGKLS